MSRNEELFARAKDVIPGGVDSPVRAFGAVGGNIGDAKSLACHPASTTHRHLDEHTAPIDIMSELTYHRVNAEAGQAAGVAPRRGEDATVLCGRAD